MKKKNMSYQDKFNLVYSVLVDANKEEYESFKKFLDEIDQNAREEERKKAFEIAQTYIINKQVGSQQFLPIAPNLYKNLLKFGIPSVENKT